MSSKNEAAKTNSKKRSATFDRSGLMDVVVFLAPALAFKFTNIVPIFVTGLLRIISIRTFKSLHYIFVEKDNYNIKLNETQINRARVDYLVAPVLHMWSQTLLQIICPSLFFASGGHTASGWWNAFFSHVLVVELSYFVAHIWLRCPMIKDSFSNALPSTSLVQDLKELFIFIAVFGPAFLFPFVLAGRSHWSVLCAYLIVFDIINAHSRTSIPLRDWLFNSIWSPLHYAFGSPDFNLGHHKQHCVYNNNNDNDGTLMALWEHMFVDPYRKCCPSAAEESAMLPMEQQNLVFIGHNGGIGHILTCPEFSVFNVYDKYIRTWLPIQVEFLLMDVVGFFCRLLINSYKVSRYVVDGKYIGRIICIVRTPMDYIKSSRHPSVNVDIVNLIEREHKAHGTRYFGLGNLNKMKQLNEGGTEIVRLVRENEYLKDKNIRIWTGRTLTSASVYNQIINIPNIKEVFYIGASGEVGNSVTHLLAERGIKVIIYSRYQSIVHQNVSYTTNLQDMAHYRHVIIGKLLNPSAYHKAMRDIKKENNGTGYKTRFLLDYTVPHFPLSLADDIHHMQIGVLSVGSKPDGSSAPLIRGHFDVCMGHGENQIYPCHAGCILNMLEKKETHEVGEVFEVQRMWRLANSHGLHNRTTNIPIS